MLNNLRQQIEHSIDYMQFLKWIIYTLLLVNFAYYFFEDSNAAQHTLNPDFSLLEWAGAYATSFDELAWFTLLFIFELETYWLEDDFENRLVTWTLQGLRVICYALVLHTTYAYSVYALDLADAVPLLGTESVCQLTGQDLSFLRNLTYTAIELENCAELSLGGELFRLIREPVVTDTAGLAQMKGLAWADVAESASWLVIVLLIEFAVQIQNAGVYKGTLISRSNFLKWFLYAVISGIAIYWAQLGHYIYTLDEFLWIAGFAALDLNLSEWRDELQSSADTQDSQTH